MQSTLTLSGKSQKLWSSHFLANYPSDYAGKELFAIEADSLLRECFLDEHLDFQGMSEALLDTRRRPLIILKEDFKSCMPSTLLNLS